MNQVLRRLTHQFSLYHTAITFSEMKFISLALARYILIVFNSKEWKCVKFSDNSFLFANGAHV